MTSHGYADNRDELIKRVNRLEGHVRHCVADAVRADNADPKVRELIDTLGRVMGR